MRLTFDFGREESSYMRKMTTTLVLVLLALAGAAQGEIFINFNVPPSGAAGSISYAGGSSALVGSGITISDIIGVNTPAYSGSLACVGCTLNFTTLGAISSSASNWSFGGGSGTAFTIYGTAPTAGITSATTLLSGYFNGATVDVLGFGTFRVMGASTINTINTSLFNFLMGAGASSAIGTTFSANYVQQFTAVAGAGYSFKSATLLDGQVSNLVPEPTSMLLSGTVAALIGLALVRRRRALKS